MALVSVSSKARMVSVRTLPKPATPSRTLATAASSGASKMLTASYRPMVRYSAVIFTPDPEGMRAFFRDVLGLNSVDAGGGWLIFALPPAELAAHPAEDGPSYQLYLMCDDIEASVEELKGKGVEFTRPVSDQGWGLLTAFAIPGGGELALYEPRHPRPQAPQD